MFLKHFFPVLKLVGVNSKQEAEVFKGHYINIKRKHAVKLPKGHYFICDIVGLRVFDEHNHYIGIITDLLETGANDVYVVKTKDKGDVLIPAIKQVVKKIDLAKGVMVIKPQEGML